MVLEVGKCKIKALADSGPGRALFAALRPPPCCVSTCQRVSSLFLFLGHGTHHRVPTSKPHVDPVSHPTKAPPPNMPLRGRVSACEFGEHSSVPRRRPGKPLHSGVDAGRGSAFHPVAPSLLKALLTTKPPPLPLRHHPCHDPHSLRAALLASHPPYAHNPWPQGLGTCYCPAQSSPCLLSQPRSSCRSQHDYDFVQHHHLDSCCHVQPFLHAPVLSAVRPTAHCGHWASASTTQH